MRRWGAIGIALVALVAVALLIAGYRFYDYTEYDPRFCGSCHIMNTAFKTWSEGPHKNVNCHVCHQQNIQDRARIVFSWLTSRIDKVPPHTQLAKTVCESCHLNDQVKWPQIRKTAGHDIHMSRGNLPCLSCHLPSLHSVKPKTEDCVKCHNKARTNIGGMAGFHCITCHQFLAGKETGLEPKREACLGCHSAMKVKGETFPEHAPMQFDCGACHKPHTQPILKFNDCLGCHPQIATDKTHFERDLTTCVSCHRPHEWKARPVAKASTS